MFDFKQIHKNSFRFGWRTNEYNDLELWAYTYINGTRTAYRLCNIETQQKYRLSLYRNEKSVIFEVVPIDEKGQALGDSIRIDFDFDSKIKYGYKLGTFYGGKHTAPKKVEVLFF
jgi:hypothetical protein